MARGASEDEIVCQTGFRIRLGPPAGRGDMESTRRTADLISGAIWKVRYFTLVLLFQHEQLALSPYARERAAMDGTGAVAVEGGEVVGGAVALVAGGRGLRDVGVRLVGRRAAAALP